ncbi:MAG: TolC family protein [Planctomycetales bacterium]|nr:TolC family protein [Planctomycetales bacterium]
MAHVVRGLACGLILLAGLRLHAGSPWIQPYAFSTPVLRSWNTAESGEWCGGAVDLPSTVVPTVALTWNHPSQTPANVDGDGQVYLATYLDRVAQSTDHGSLGSQPDAGIPATYQPWWQAEISKKLVTNSSAVRVNVDGLIQSALAHSPFVRVLNTEPNIRQSAMVEEAAAFDWRAFLESNYDDLNDPIGNTLTTGNNDTRFTEQHWTGSGGVRRRNVTGGEFEITQRLGHQKNNSRFFVPQPQGTARLELNYTQPLLNGAGRAYNESRVITASIDTRVTQDEVSEKIQEHLLKVTEAYWELYRARSTFLQKQKVLHAAHGILENLEGRQHVDTIQRQVLRARAAVATRRSEIARSYTAVRNAESQLRLLVNDPALLQPGTGEFMPLDIPLAHPVDMSMRDGLAMALWNRPDISKAIRAIRATSVELGVARNEVLPKLDLLLSTYVAGLEGNSEVFSAYGNQFAEGRPGFSVGLLFEVPLGKRAGRARFERRQWELTRATEQLRLAVETALAETEQSIREVDTTYQEMVGRYEAMLAADDETKFLIDRWQTLPGIDDSATLLLEDLLDSQARLADEEAAFVQAQVNYSVSLVRVRKAMGTLLRCGTTDSTVALQSQTTSTLPLDNVRLDLLPPPPQDAAPAPTDSESTPDDSMDRDDPDEKGPVARRLPSPASDESARAVQAKIGTSESPFTSKTDDSVPVKRAITIGPAFPTPE